MGPDEAKRVGIVQSRRMFERVTDESAVTLYCIVILYCQLHFLLFPLSLLLCFSPLPLSLYFISFASAYTVPFVDTQSLD